MEFDNIETIKRALEINAGISILPLPTVLREVKLGSLVTVPLIVQEGKPALHRPLGIIHHRGRALSPTAERFVMELMDLPMSETSRIPASRIGMEDQAEVAGSGI